MVVRPPEKTGEICAGPRRERRAGARGTHPGSREPSAGAALAGAGAGRGERGGRAGPPAPDAGLSFCTSFPEPSHVPPRFCPVGCDLNKRGALTSFSSGRRLELGSRGPCPS